MKEHTAQTRRERQRGSLLFCLLLSLLLHLGLAWALDLLPRPTRHRAEPTARATRHVQVRRSQPQEKKKPAAAQPKTQQPDEQQPFVKTPADEPERRPEQADFTSNHDSVARGEEDAPQRRSDAPQPTMAGQEREDEIVTFDQERQDGATEHEGKRSDAPAPQPPLPPADADRPLPPQAVTQGAPDGSPQESHPQGEGNAPLQPQAESTAAVNPEPPAPGEGLRLDERHRDEAQTLTPQVTPPAPLGQPEGSEEGVPVSHSIHAERRPVHDPSLAAHVKQPGLRTYERRTRSTGRFIFGSRPSLNVAATPRGRYEAEIYRRIARMWYAACDEHRGDIIPGSITVSLRLTRSGSIDSMDLIRRRGASLIQQSFSFGAIRRAALPPMPEVVQQGIIGELYEIILTFNFD